MIIHGREVRFRRTVLGNCEIAEVCPGKDISRFGEVVQEGYSSAQKAAAVFVVAMSKGWEMNQKYENPGYEMRPLTTEEVMLLGDEEFAALFQEAFDAFGADGKTTVEAEEPKGKNE